MYTYLCVYACEQGACNSCELTNDTWIQCMHLFEKKLSIFLRIGNP